MKVSSATRASSWMYGRISAAPSAQLRPTAIGRAQRLEVDVARARVVDVGADAGGLGRRAERAGDEARLVGRAELVRRRAGQPGRLEVHLARQRRHPVVLLRDGGRAEGVGLDQVGAGREVALVDVADD